MEVTLWNISNRPIFANLYCISNFNHILKELTIIKLINSLANISLWQIPVTNTLSGLSQQNADLQQLQQQLQQHQQNLQNIQPLLFLQQNQMGGMGQLGQMAQMPANLQQLQAQLLLQNQVGWIFNFRMVIFKIFQNWEW